MKKIWLIFCISTLILSGCWDRQEINDVAFVVGTAVDKAEQGYSVSLQIALPGQMGGPNGGGGGTSGAKKWYIDTETGKTVRASHEKQQRSVSRQLNFSHRRIVVIGEEIAKEGVTPVLDIFIRAPLNRLTAFPIVAKGKGQDLLSVEAPIEQFPAEMVRELVQMNMSEPENLRTFIYKVLTEGIDPIALVLKKDHTNPGKGEDKKTLMEVTGLAIFKYDKLVGILEGEKALGLLIAMERAKRPMILVEGDDETNKFNVQLQEIQVKMKPTIKKSEPSVSLIVRAKGNIYEDNSKHGLTTDQDVRERERMINEKLAKIIKDGVNSIQKMEADSLGIGATIYRKNPQFWNQIRNDWSQHYSKMKISIKVDTQIEHSGVTIQPLPRKGRDMEK
jgi:Ger(x)C family germination protein